MLKKIILLSVLGAVMVLGFSFNYTKDHLEPSLESQVISQVASQSEELIIPNTVSEVFGLYSDGSKDLKEMKKTTDHIILGKVLSANQSSPVAVSVKVEIIDTLKGNHAKNEIIEISQLGTIDSEEILDINSKYILFINNQLNSNWYYIRAGVEGVFPIDELDDTLKASTNNMKDDLVKVFNLKKNDELKVNVNKFIKYITDLD